MLINVNEPKRQDPNLLHLHAMKIKAMKNLLFVVMLAPFLSAGAQDKDKIMDTRVREFHRVIGLDDQESWKEFIRKTYTEAFINKPSSRRVVVDGEEKSAAGTNKGTDKVREKAELFQMLHRDFGSSKLISLIVKENIATLVLSNSDGLRGTFKFTHQKQAPYLIDNMAVEAEMDR